MINQITKERSESYTEVLEILNNMEFKYIEKIPLELREFFKKNASKEYKFHIDSSIPLEEYKLKDNTINILAMLNLNYWCESEEHKQELLKKYYKNDIKKQEELDNKYNLDDLFKRNNKKIIVNKQEDTNNLPLQYEEVKWYKKVYDSIIKFIKGIFNKE